MLEAVMLASSSRGNALLIRGGGTALLVDAGISARSLVARLEEAGTDPGSLNAVCISHEHRDHIAGLDALHRRYAIPVYANRGTAQGAARIPGLDRIAWRTFETGSDFRIGALNVHPFAVPHDAYEPVGFIFECGGARLGVATDLGMPTSLIRARLKGCHGLVLEANHDERMVRRSGRPLLLKSRILGRLGHLSNDMAADLAAELAGPHLQWIILAHLSEECNERALCERAMRDRLAQAGCAHVRVEVARARAPTPAYRILMPAASPETESNPPLTASVES